MNALIQEIAAQGRSQEIYNTVNNAALIIALLYSFWHGKKLGVPLWKMFILLLALYLGMNYIQGAIWELLLYISNREILGIQTAVNSIVRVFIFVPVIGFVFAKILRLNARLVWDATAMFPLLRSAFAQIACAFLGCCAGHPVGWGLYNKATSSYHFPVQLIETGLTLVVFVWLLCRFRKHKFQSDGRYMPYMFIGYGIQRFVCEALRDNEKLLPLCSAIGIHALLLCMIGIVWLLVEHTLKVKEKKT